MSLACAHHNHTAFFPRSAARAVVAEPLRSRRARRPVRCGGALRGGTKAAAASAAAAGGVRVGEEEGRDARARPLPRRGTFVPPRPTLGAASAGFFHAELHAEGHDPCYDPGYDPCGHDDLCGHDHTLLHPRRGPLLRRKMQEKESRLEAWEELTTGGQQQRQQRQRPSSAPATATARQQARRRPPPPGHDGRGGGGEGGGGEAAGLCSRSSRSSSRS